MRIAPGPREDGWSSAAVGSLLLEEGVNTVPGSRNDDHMVEAVGSTHYFPR